MASTITNLINTIDVNYPIAGQDNDSQGFRNNFSIIQQSLLAQEGEIEQINNTISTLGGSVYVTATHIVALQDVTIGTTNTAVLSVTESGIVAQVNTGSMVLIGLSQTIDASVAFAITDSVTDSTATTFAVLDASDIIVGARVTIGGANRTVTNIDRNTNYITVTPAFTVPSFNVGDVLTFNNPYTQPVGNLFLDGDIVATGNITAFAGSPSDARLKENISTITNALSMVNAMRGVMYEWTDAYLENVNFSPFLTKQDTGVIAQEMQEVFPEIVFMKPNGDLSVKYEKLTGVFIEAIKELSSKVASLEAQISALTTSTNV